jgi:hypothetical protein
MRIDKELVDELKRRNEEIARHRKEVFDDAMGVQAVIFRNLPQFLTIFDLMRERGIEVPPYNLAVVTNGGWKICDNIGQLASLLRQNLVRADIEDIINNRNCRGLQVLIDEDYLPHLQHYLEEFAKDD